MKINFYLPGVFLRIIGGYKVVYQYANYLCKCGYDVCIYYDGKDGDNGKKIPKSIALFLRRIIVLFTPRWFKLNKSIKKVVVKHFDDNLVRDADISIATAYKTVESVYNFSNSKGIKVYLIQGYEKWDEITDEDLIASYGFGMNNIVISKWLKEIVDKSSLVSSKLIPNGIDLDRFRIINSIDNRNPHSLALLYHKAENKGLRYALEAINKLKENYPDMQCMMYGSPKRPKDLPSWIKYTRNASEVEVVNILNNSAVFLCSSLSEGFGLPGMEAMACGCALVTTNCQGIMEYANTNNALISEISNADSLATNVGYLFSNNEKRIKLAKIGNRSISEKSLDKSLVDFERYINSLLEEENEN